MTDKKEYCVLRRYDGNCIAVQGYTSLTPAEADGCSEWLVPRDELWGLLEAEAAARRLQDIAALGEGITDEARAEIGARDYTGDLDWEGAEPLNTEPRYVLVDGKLVRSGGEG